MMRCSQNLPFTGHVTCCASGGSQAGAYSFVGPILQVASCPFDTLSDLQASCARACTGCPEGGCAAAAAAGGGGERSWGCGWRASAACHIAAQLWGGAAVMKGLRVGEFILMSDMCTCVTDCMLPDLSLTACCMHRWSC